MEKRTEWLEKIKQNKKYAVICILIAVLCFVPVFFDVIMQRHPVSYDMGNIVDNVPDAWRLKSMESIAGGEISQTFTCSLQNITQIVLYEAEGVGPDDGDIHVSLLDDEAGELIDEWTVKQSDVTDDGKFSLSVRTPLKHSGLYGKRCRLVIAPEDKADKAAVALKFLPEEQYGRGTLEADAAAAGGELIMNIVGCKAPKDLLISKCFLCFYITLLFEWFVYRFFKRRKRPVDMESAGE